MARYVAMQSIQPRFDGMVTSRWSLCVTWRSLACRSLVLINCMQLPDP